MKKFNETSGSEKGCFGCLTVIVAIITFCFFYIAGHPSDPNKKSGIFSMDIIIPLMHHDEQSYSFIGNVPVTSLPDYIQKTMPEHASMDSKYYSEKLFNQEYSFVKNNSINRRDVFAGPFFGTRYCISMAFYLDSEKTLKSKLKSLTQEELEIFKLTHESKFISDKFVILAKLAYKDKNYELAKAYFNCWGLWHMTPQQYNEGKIPYDVYKEAGMKGMLLFDE